MPQKHAVQLSDGDRQQLRSLLRKGKASARCLTRARILLAADEQQTDAEIVEQLDVSVGLIYQVRRRFVGAGLHAALHRRAHPPRPEARKLDGDGEAHLLALACGAPPNGREVWTLRLLADRMVELKHTDALSHETVRTVLKKTRSSRG
jgi:Homeodomain-like domain